MASRGATPGVITADLPRCSSTGGWPRGKDNCPPPKKEVVYGALRVDKARRLPWCSDKRGGRGAVGAILPSEVRELVSVGCRMLGMNTSVRGFSRGISPPPPLSRSGRNALLSNNHGFKSTSNRQGSSGGISKYAI